MRTFRPILLFIATLFCIGSAEAQAVRFDYIASTTSAQCAPGKQCPLVVLPGTQVNICSGSVTTLASCLSSPATTYTDASTGTPCATTSQLTPQTGGSCRATSDNQGNYGFWILPGSYNYFLRVPATAGGGTYGPYPLAIGASAGCPLGATCDANYVTLPLACAAAGSGLLYVTRAWTGLTSQTFACPMSFTGNGSLRPNSAQTVAFNVVSSPYNHPICDGSSGGICNITNATGEVYAYFWGAINDGTNDITAKMNAALASVVVTHQALRWVPGNGYVASGTGLQLNANNQTVVVRGGDPHSTFILWKGAGSGITNAAVTISNCYRCEFSGIGVVANTNVLDFAIVLKAQLGGLQSQGHFSNLWITDTSNSGKLKVGIYGYVPTPADDFQNDLMTFSKVLISNIADEGAGMLMEGFEDGEWSIDQNSTFQGGQCAITNGPLVLSSGTYGLGYSGSFQWSGGYVAAHKLADFCLGAVSGGVVRIAGNLRSEVSNRFLITTPATGSAFPIPVDIQGVTFSTGGGSFASDGKVIVYTSGKALHIADSIFGVAGSSVPVKVSLTGNGQTTGNNNGIERTSFFGSNTNSLTGLFPDDLPQLCFPCSVGDDASATTAFNFFPTLNQASLGFSAGVPVTVQTTDSNTLTVKAGGSNPASITLQPTTGKVQFNPSYGTVGGALCIKDTATTIGFCSSAVASNGTCTCN